MQEMELSTTQTPHNIALEMKLQAMMSALEVKTHSTMTALEVKLEARVTKLEVKMDSLIFWQRWVAIAVIGWVVIQFTGINLADIQAMAAH